MVTNPSKVLTHPPAAFLSFTERRINFCPPEVYANTGVGLVEVARGAPVPVLLLKNCQVYPNDAPPIDGVWSSKKILSPVQKTDCITPLASPYRVIKLGCGEGTITIFAMVT